LTGILIPPRQFALPPNREVVGSTGPYPDPAVPERKRSKPRLSLVVYLA